MNKNNNKIFYNIHNLIKIAVDEVSVNSREHKHYLRFFEVPELKDMDRVASVKTYEPTLPPIQKILTTHGVTFVHSLGVELDGRGVIFPASGGVGKTSLVSYLRNIPGFRFFGDDFVIVAENGIMYSFPSDFSIYPYHLKLFPEIKNMEQGKYLKNRKYISWFYFIRKVINYIAKRLSIFSHPLLSGWNAEYAKVPATALVVKEKIGDKINLSASVFLERYNGKEIVKEELSSKETVEGILEILKRELNLKDITKEKSILISVFSKIKCYRVCLPEKLSNEDYFEFMNQFLKTI